ncbi:50S ribosomal protein L11 methyltransferase [Leptolyngbya sp. BC1307]|uniref:50S ribosomal protein L11 methyltransferase n=1 Tax=Leptolyngbya sp. BC1307 TaxID=2029589 RepID=UPI000EFA67B1|nr:50S ribosomal protein L11 methyltransferase [Leptolyngbya sp. BC1307]
MTISNKPSVNSPVNPSASPSGSALNNQWWAVSVACSPALEDSVYWQFEQMGSKGTASQQQNGDCTVTAYLLQSQYQPSDFEALQATLNQNAAEGNLPDVRVSWRLIADEDWASSWKTHWQAEEIGDRLLINPAWMTPPATERAILTLDPGSAFGTGAHATTQLCLKVLEKQDLVGATVADIGCGSGILSIAALLYGANRAYAADVDPLAVTSTRANAKLNGISLEQLQVQLGSLPEVIAMTDKPVNGIVCNILAEIIVALIIPRLGELAAPAGQPPTWGILSGILTAKAPWVERHLTVCGWQVVDLTEQDEWCAMTIQRRL